MPKHSPPLTYAPPKKTQAPKQDSQAQASKDSSEAFLDTLPELVDGERFLFACNESVPCFNRCCAELTLPLTPYDVLRLCRHLELGSDEFLRNYTQMRTFPDTGFPLPLLKMQSSPDEPCPFVSPAGCIIYEDRPGACRTYPLGRGTKVDAAGNVVERFFIVQEDHCRGFDAGKEWTAHQWLKDQGLDPYNDSNDRYMRIMAKVKNTKAPVTAKMATMVVLCLYQLDRFRTFLADMKIFSKLDISTERCEAVMGHDEDCLEFAFDWLELVMFGTCENLRRTS